MILWYRHFNYIVHNQFEDGYGLASTLVIDKVIKRKEQLIIIIGNDISFYEVVAVVH
ncbi:MAG: hypothetical protein ACTS85_05245 [Arsenophonus sp. NC-PG7-MAG3]